MESEIDKYLWTKNQAYGDMPEILRATLQDNSPETVTHADIERMIHTFSFRAFPTKRGLVDLSSQLGFIDYEHDGQFEAEVQDSNSVIEFLSKVAQGHEYMQFHKKQVKVGTPNAKILIEYDSSRWEGIGGIYFSAEHDKKSFPLFVIRGNPTFNDEKLRFDIRAIQPWVGETMFLHNAKDQDFWEEVRGEGVTEANIINAKNTIQQRQRIIDQLIRKMHNEINLYEETSELPPAELFLLLGTAYLQGTGVQELRGIEHSHHPEVEKLQHINYNQLFVTQFEYELTEEQYPWKLENHGGNFAINNLNILPPTLKRMLIDTYEAAAKQS